MAFIVNLSSDELGANLAKFRIEQRFTKSRPKSLSIDAALDGPPIVLLVGEALSEAGGARSRWLAWVGIAARHGTVGAVDKSITVDPLRECMAAIPLDGSDGILSDIPEHLRREFDLATPLGMVGACSNAVWQALERALRARFPELSGLLDWLLAQADPPVFEDNSADHSWQEQRDATGSLLRIADFPLSALAAWRRPPSGDDPYTAGLIPQPVEHSLIDYDVRVAGDAFGMFSEWQQGNGVRCDIHVLHDPSGRRLEVVNVNATPVESRLGTDMLYYHEPTKSFVFVQYKRLHPDTRSIYVDERLRGQLDRLEETAQLSSPPARPSEWRLGGDPCFLKLAYWPRNTEKRPVQGLTPGMYLPVSYVRLLLEDDCTRGRKAGSTARILGYDQVERHLTGTQFIDLVKHGLAGTVGTTREQLYALVKRRISTGHSVVLATETSDESVRARQTRVRDRGAKRRTYTHRTYRQEPLEGLDL
ncbi:hypothetical protein SFUL_3206 [Streptomyces microflavus DSM 40593]|uniref:Uncharacterized protein n=1 Tax=Streptomyces microflavus DSM 40593 TaxID=1303692 RepID=N0CR61_STRMI|nr:hypothetical protein [Streptomyces microflavus]AGK78140.1 hypothetical protein SFUL_3206 [Streptomyces microflavus DSM 40593]